MHTPHSLLNVLFLLSFVQWFLMCTNVVGINGCLYIYVFVNWFFCLPLVSLNLNFSCRAWSFGANLGACKPPCSCSSWMRMNAVNFCPHWSNVLGDYCSIPVLFSYESLVAYIALQKYYIEFFLKTEVFVHNMQLLSSFDLQWELIFHTQGRNTTFIN